MRTTNEPANAVVVVVVLKPEEFTRST